jgi:hypothetical protein
MSSAASRRSAGKPNWAALLSDVRAEDEEARSLFPNGKWRDTSHGVDYVDALQEALEAREFGRLMAMLDAGCPIPDCLLPMVAEVIRDIRHGRSTGRPKKLTALADESIREGFDLAVKHAGLTREKACGWLASIMGVSTDTIERSLRRSKSK